MSDDDAILEAVGRVLKAETGKLQARLQYADLRIAKLEERLNAALDRLDALETLAEASAPVLRHVDPRGRVKLIKAL